jgi:hypothetical protein
MMRKESEGRKMPVVPRVAAETWKELFLAGEGFRGLAPWKWMDDSQLVGLRDPKSREVLLGSILGRLGQVFALVVYRNDAGRRWVLETILNQGGGVEEEDALYKQDAIKLEFVLKRELAKDDKAGLTTAGFTPASKVGRVWPVARSFTPGGYPWHVTQEEAETLAWALPRVLAVARLAQKKPDLWEWHGDGEVAFIPGNFDPAQDELTADQIDWQPMIPPPEPEPTKVSVDDEAIIELLNLGQAKGFQLEVDVSYSTMAVAGIDRPRFPKLVMAVDRNSGFVGGLQLSESNDTDGARALGAVLHKALKQIGARPEAILVQRGRVGAMLEKLAAQLEIPVVSDANLEALNFARADLEQHFRGR